MQDKHVVVFQKNEDREKFINKIEYRIKANAFKGKLPTIAKIRWN